MMMDWNNITCGQNIFSHWRCFKSTFLFQYLFYKISKSEICSLHNITCHFESRKPANPQNNLKSRTLFDDKIDHRFTVKGEKTNKACASPGGAFHKDPWWMMEAE